MGKPAPCDLERWAGRPIGKRHGSGYRPGTGRCEPRSPVPGLEARGEQWGEPVANTPRATGFLRFAEIALRGGKPRFPPPPPPSRRFRGVGGPPSRQTARGAAVFFGVFSPPAKTR